MFGYAAVFALWLLASAVYVAPLLWPMSAHAQGQQQFTLLEQRYAICSVETARLQQALSEAQAKIAELSKAQKPANPPGVEHSAPEVKHE